MTNQITNAQNHKLIHDLVAYVVEQVAANTHR